LDLYLGPTYEVVVLGHADDLVADLRRQYVPRKVLAFRAAPDGSLQSASLAALFDGKRAIDGQPSAYVCENFACRAPVAGRDAIGQLWERLAKGQGAPH